MESHTCSTLSKGLEATCEDDAHNFWDDIGRQGVKVHLSADDAEQKRAHNEAPEPAGVLFDGPGQVGAMLSYTQHPYVNYTHRITVPYKGINCQ